jgi:hypothetical protein
MITEIDIHHVRYVSIRRNHQDDTQWITLTIASEVPSPSEIPEAGTESITEITLYTFDKIPIHIEGDVL